jgi:hypothetical protein
MFTNEDFAQHEVTHNGYTFEIVHPSHPALHRFTH